MPFMELNYSTYEATIMLQQSFDFKLKQMQKPANILSRLMGINCDYHKPRKPILRFLVLLHRVFICIFGVFLTLAFLFEILCLYHQHGNDGNSLGRNLFLLLVKFQGLLNFAFILFWNFGHYQEKIRNELLM
uniref:Uncharacterized protein n=1 Tax=Acrobeloides nanus TaxID=290746 RepID=A0A914CAJ8_9BILA